MPKPPRECVDCSADISQHHALRLRCNKCRPEHARQINTASTEALRRRRGAKPRPKGIDWEKRIAQQDAWRAANAQRLNQEKAAYRRSRPGGFKSYSISQEEYDSILLQQGGGCAICGCAPPVGRNRRLCIDHDHKTGRRRGLLCNRCNPGIGHLKDDVALVEKAAAYLRSWQ